MILLFSGQGAQSVGMGRDLVEKSETARRLFAQADDILGWSLTDVMFNGPAEKLTKTGNCQPALFLHGLTLLAMLKEARPDLKFSAAAGLSLGEMTAHAAVGTFTFEDGLRLVARRGELMDEACEATKGAMAAVIGGSLEEVTALAEACGVDVANLNCPGQTVLSGPVTGIDQVVAEAKAHGARMAKKLQVAGAYHSRLMADAQKKLSGELLAATISDPQMPVISNFLAEAVTSADQVADTLTRQVTGSVRWEESMRLLLDQGHTEFLELGPGKVLAGLMARIDKSATIHAVENADDLEAWLQK